MRPDIKISTARGSMGRPSFDTQLTHSRHPHSGFSVAGNAPLRAWRWNVCPSPRAFLGGSSSQMSGSHRASMCSSTRKHVVMWGLRTPWVRRLCTKRYATGAIFALCQIPVKTPDRCQNEARGAPRAPRLSVMNLCQNMMHACTPRVNIQ